MSAGNPDQKVYVYAVFSSLINGEHPGDHNHQDFPQSTACDTNGRRIAIQMGGVLKYFPFLRAQWCNCWGVGETSRRKPITKYPLLMLFGFRLAGR